jgi:hypothetical protein
MVNDPEKNHRKSIRLQGYDYTAAGYYFSTICTHQWQCYFGEVHNVLVLRFQAASVGGRSLIGLISFISCKNLSVGEIPW